MRTKKSNKKLVFKKETIGNLDAVTMKDIHGGNSFCTNTCFYTVFNDLCQTPDPLDPFKDDTN